MSRYADDPLGRSTADRKAWLATLKTHDVVVRLDGGHREPGWITSGYEDGLRWNGRQVSLLGAYAGRVTIQSITGRNDLPYWLAPATVDEAAAFRVQERDTRRRRKATYRVQELSASTDRLKRQIASFSDLELDALEAILDLFDQRATLPETRR